MMLVVTTVDIVVELIGVHRELSRQQTGAAHRVMHMGQHIVISCL